MSVAESNQGIFDASPEHKVGMALHSLTSAASLVHDLSLLPEYRDAMVKELGDISRVCHALNLVWSRVKAREAA